MLSSFILTLQFFTRIPIPVQVDVKEDSFAKGITFLPIIGLIMGLIYMLTYKVLFLGFGFDIAIFGVIVGNIILTGALHVDGLADTCDGIYSSRSKERMLEIMKDSRVGTNGVIAIIVDMGLRYLLLKNIGPELAVIAILLSPVAAKTAVAIIIGISKCGRKNGLGAIYLDHERKNYVIMAVIFGAIILGLALQVKGLILLACLGLLAFLFRNYITKKIDGMTGDTLGAFNELMEMFLLGFILLIGA